MPTIIRRMRTRAPTCLSIGLGAFLAINRSYDCISPPDLTQLSELAIEQIFTGPKGFPGQQQFTLPGQQFAHETSVKSFALRTYLFVRTTTCTRLAYAPL